MEFAANKNKCFDVLNQLKRMTILELGPCHGLDTVVLASLALHVDAIEGRHSNAEQVKELTAKLNNVSVIEADLETYDLKQLVGDSMSGKYGAVCAIGILYHLLRPWDLIRNIQEVTNLCVGWTHLVVYAPDNFEGHRVWKFPEDNSPFASLGQPYSHWLMPDDFVACWKDWDFEWLTIPEPHPNGGLAAQFLATARKD